MAQTYKSLGRANPAGETPTTLYTAPAATTMLLGALHICNQTQSGSGADDSVSVWIVPSGGAADNTNVIIVDMVVDQFDPYLLTSPIVLMTGDFIVVESTNGNVTFSAFGLEIT